MNKIIILIILTLILIISSTDCNAAPLPIGSAFNYQGELLDTGSPANGNYDIGFEFFTTEIWINLYVTKTGSGLPYIELLPRQRLNTIPYAVQADF